MGTVNRVILLGNLGRDPELRMTASGTPMVRLSLATGWKSRRGDGTVTEGTEWHRVVGFGRQAEICNQYLSKGRQVFIEGRLQSRKWKDPEGNDRYTTEVVLERMTLLGGQPGRGEAREDDMPF